MLITHDLELAAAVCDRTLVMYGGRIMEEQASWRLHDAPLHPYTAALLASRPSLTVQPEYLEVIPGRPLSAVEAPAGCPFANCCALTIPECSESAPVVRKLRGGRTSCATAARWASSASPARARRRSRGSSSGFEKASAGEYAIGGVDPRSLGRRAKARKQRARLVQMVFQDPYSSFDPRQPVAESIRQVLRLHFDLTEAERERRVATLLEQVGLDERRGQTLPRGLSGGGRQRAAIARALAVEPQLVILDEAVSALDVSIQAQILNLLTELRQQTAVSYVLLTHDLAVVRQVADDVIVMRDC